MATVLRGESPGLCRYIQKEQITRKHKGEPLGFDNPLGNDIFISIYEHCFHRYGSELSNEL